MVAPSHFSERALYDFELVQRAKQGDQKAVAELMERYQDSIIEVAFKFMKNRKDAKEISVEAFDKAFSRLDQFNSDFAFSIWLYRIASNACLEAIGRRKLLIKV
jgi:RNA polymerase sigma factor (sigma-70 family)